MVVVDCQYVPTPVCWGCNAGSLLFPPFPPARDRSLAAQLSSTPLQSSDGAERNAVVDVLADESLGARTTPAASCETSGHKKAATRYAGIRGPAGEGSSYRGMRGCGVSNAESVAVAYRSNRRLPRQRRSSGGR
jgi:hypothetical protein